MSIREAFVERFGEDNAVAIERAAAEHESVANATNKGNDHFRWALIICIGSNCMSCFAEYHRVTAPWSELKPWIKENAKLHEHVGDVDYLALLAGAYNEYMPKEPSDA